MTDVDVREAIDHACSPGMCQGRPAWDAQLCADTNGCLEPEAPSEATKRPVAAQDRQIGTRTPPRASGAFEGDE